ncbi:MAG: CoA transferase, partial [Chloroflexota bacterium]
YKVGVAIVDITAGLFASSAILAALHERSGSGRGQYIDVALLDTQVAWLANVAHNYFATGRPPGRYGNAHANIVPYEVFPTSDGHLALAIGTDGQYRRFCEIVGRPDLWDDDRFQSNAGRVENRDELVPLLQDVCRQRPTEAWIEVLVAAGIPAGPINDIPAVLADPHVQARQMVHEVDHATAGRIQMLGPVARLSRTPAAIRQAPPALGADTEQILAERLGYAPETIEVLKREGII